MSQDKSSALPPVKGPAGLPEEASQPQSEINVRDLMRAMPIETAKKLEGRVDKNHDGHITADELGQLFHELEEDEAKIKTLRWELLLAVVFLGVSIVANLGTAMYAAEEARSTDTKPDPAAAAAATVMQSEPAYELTDKAGHILRTDRTKDKITLTSQLPNSAFNELESLEIKGPTGEINFKVQGWARYSQPDSSRCGSVVVVYTVAGHVQFDGVAMSFDESVNGAFSRAGFSVSSRRIRSRRADSSGAYTLSGINEVVGMFNFVAQLDTSSLRCGDDIPSVENNPFATATDVLLTQTLLMSCGDTGHKGVTGDDRPACPEGQELETIKGVSYFKRNKAMHAKKMDGKWSSVAVVTIPEYTDGRLVEFHHDSITHSFTDAYFKNCTNLRKVEAARDGLGFAAQPPPADAAKDMTMEFAGYEVLNGVYVRHYRITLPSLGAQWQSVPEVTVGDGAGDVQKAGVLDFYEHYDENRLYSLGVAAPLMHTTYDVIKVNPTVDDLVGAGLSTPDVQLANVATAADMAAKIAHESYSCYGEEDSRGLNHTDLATYHHKPWTAAADEAKFEEYTKALSGALAAPGVNDPAVFAQLAADNTGNASLSSGRSRRGGSHCLDASQRSSNGGKVHMWECNSGNANQQWSYNSGTGQIKNRHGICLDASQRGSNGGIVHMWDCNTGNANQQWTYDSGTGQIKNRHGICLDASQRSSNGGKVHMWSCDTNNANQQWRLDGYIFRAGGGITSVSSNGVSHKVGPFTFSLEYSVNNGAQQVAATFSAEACFPGLCGNPKAYVKGQLQAVLSVDPESCEITASVSIGFCINVIVDICFEVTYGMGLVIQDGMIALKAWVSRKLSVGVASVEASIAAYWRGPWKIISQRVPTGAGLDIEVCAFWICGGVGFDLSWS